MVERLVRIQEVRGSIPLISTITQRYELLFFANVFCLIMKTPWKR